MVGRQLIFLSFFLALAAPAGAQEAAVKSLRSAARAAPKDAAAQTALGRALVRAGRLAEAERYLRAAARLQRQSLGSLYELAKVKFASGNHKASRAACRTLAKKDKDAVLTHLCMARAYLVWRRSARAFEHLEKAQAKDPNNVEVILALGDAHRMRGSATKARKAYARAIELDPKNARAHFGVGLLEIVAGQRGKAIEALRLALERDSACPKIQLELGRLLDGAEARRLLEQAVAGRPKWNEAELALADELLSEGQAQAAEKMVLGVLARDAKLADAHVLLGRARLALNNPKAAEEALHKALKLVPNNHEALLALADVLARTERHEEAFEQYRIASDAVQQDTRALLEAARLGMRLKRNVLAAGFLQRALERDPKLGEALALYGDVMAARGDKTQARKYYEQALSADRGVDRQRVKQRLKEIR